MMKEFFFISGLPRSGSTLLSGILRQNPLFYADIQSPMYSLTTNTLDVITSSDSNHIIDENKRKHILSSLFNSFYQDTNKPIIFDTHKLWTSKTSLLKELFPKTKMICCVRDIPWILDSFEKIIAKNCLYNDPHLFENKDIGKTIAERCDYLMNSTNYGQVITPYFFLEEGLLLNPDMILLVEYESLCKDPEKIMCDIYNFIDKPYFKHDFENVEYENEIYDRGVNLKGLHTVRKKVEWSQRASILPNHIWKKYSDMEFWRNSVKKENLDFRVKTIYRAK